MSRRIDIYQSLLVSKQRCRRQESSVIYSPMAINTLSDSVPEQSTVATTTIRRVFKREDFILSGCADYPSDKTAERLTTFDRKSQECRRLDNMR